MSESNPITSALVDQLEAAYTNVAVRDVLEREAYGAILAIDLLIDYAGDSDHAPELEHYLRWEQLNRHADERIIELHATRVDALLEAYVRAGNASIEAQERHKAEYTNLANQTANAAALDKWNIARLEHERAVEDHGFLEEILAASADAKAHR
jgi:hypothetical protein